MKLTIIIPVYNELATIVQDADLEYNPSEIPRLLEVANSSATQPVAVYGRRPIVISATSSFEVHSTLIVGF